MSINAYIDSLTEIDQTKSIKNITWSKVVQGNDNNIPKHSSLRGTGVVPYQFELEQTNKCPPKKKDQPRHEKHNKGEKTDSHKPCQNNQSNYQTDRFADIIPSVREVCGGYNTFSNDAIEKRFKEKQALLASAKESNANASNSMYATASSKSTEESFKTADDIKSLKITDDKSNKDVSVDIDNKDRYKKNALVTDDEDWDKDQSDESLYKNRIMKFFQSAEDEDVYVHPLKEQVQKDPEWKNYHLQRKGIEVIRTPRQHYLNLTDEDFNFMKD